jgi:acetolactate synthase regulatory subunit
MHFCKLVKVLSFFSYVLSMCAGRGFQVCTAAPTCAAAAIQVRKAAKF